MSAVYVKLMVVTTFERSEVGTAIVELLCINTDVIDLLYIRKIKRTPIEN